MWESVGVSVSVCVSVCLCSVDRDCGQWSVINSKKLSRATVVFSGVFFLTGLGCKIHQKFSAPGRLTVLTTPWGITSGGAARIVKAMPPSFPQTSRSLSRTPQAGGPASCLQCVLRGLGPSARQPHWPSSAFGSSPSGNAGPVVGEGHSTPSLVLCSQGLGARGN